MTFTHIEVEKENRIAVINLNHPPANALSQPVFEDLSSALEDVKHDDEIKAVMIAGKGRFFAAGADIKEFTSVQTAEQGSQIARVGQNVFSRIEAFSKPVIAAIHGAALGGGLELAMACHIRFATPDAKLGLPELNLGLIPGFAGTQRLPKLIGKSKALELLFTGEPVSGDEALSLGLVNRVVAGEQLLDETKAFTQKIVEKSAVSLRYLLETVTVGGKEGFSSGSQLEAQRFGEIFMSDDAKEGIQAFLEKRKPQFKDQ